MPHTRDDVIAVVQKTFPESAHARVLELLDTYAVESYERERERVQLAILKLSEGNEQKLREFVAVAKRDYRDLFFWAENPDEAKLDTPEVRAGLALTEEMGAASRCLTGEAFEKVADESSGRQREDPGPDDSFDHGPAHAAKTFHRTDAHDRSGNDVCG